MQGARMWVVTGVLLMIAHASAFGDSSDDDCGLGGSVGRPATTSNVTVIQPECGPDPERLIPEPDPIGGLVSMQQLSEKIDRLLHAEEQRTVSPTLASVVDRYLDWNRRHKAERTATDRAKLLNEFVGLLPPQVVRVNDIVAHHVTVFLDAHKGWGSTTRHNAARDLKSCLEWATKEGLISVNPLAKLKKDSPHSRETFISEEDYLLIKQHVRDLQFQDLITMAWETGGRPFELLRLEARHVRLDERCFVLPKEEGKGKRERVVMLSDIALGIVTRLVQLYPTGPLLRNCRGEAWTNNSIDNRFQRLTPKCGRKFCQYEFRHGFATRKLTEGHDCLIVAKGMGHRDTQMISKVYAHVQKSKLAELVTARPKVT